MAKSYDIGSDLASGMTGPSGQVEALTLDEADHVAGGMPFLIIAIAVGCALLLKHD